MMNYQILNGNSLELLKTLADNSVDAIVTDPPYGLSQHSQSDIVNALTAWLAGEEYDHGKNGFMNKDWDSFVPSPILFKECLRVLKHGGHILCFAGSRTQDLMSLSIRLAGFEIRDACLWLYGSGFPKGLDIAKAGAVKGTTIKNEAKQWEGWNTQLKPAYETIIMARKPLDGTIVNNVLKQGVGGLNIDACRVKTEDSTARNRNNVGQNTYTSEWGAYQTETHTQGRYPANIILDGSDSVEALFPNTKSPSGYSHRKARQNNCLSGGDMERFAFNGHGDQGSASRYFYHAKASKRDRNEGLEDFELKAKWDRNSVSENFQGMRENKKSTLPNKNTHPTVKATQLMRYLVKLVTPQGGLVLDPFMGSGSTGKACMYEGMQFVGIELNQEYCKIAEARIKYAKDNVSNE